ncbi:hypothetical protein GTY87_01035 [Streptomyces sp. SID7813]|uniref:Uncharacterized protein n=1 Tax=Streptomyces coelicolor (strain ATCC BAA-471 / A3(2) / M145) TaxID=100226 RepID=Q9S1R8_STRCO|nr:hypothetical protein [Streptomyces sp. SID7813]QFI40516.1 hypothetical protein FQ762_01060 [Streptomyces coelicolor A3(2)]THB00186.1 hypothetical protein E6R61_00530 [Streptomyces sp. LRa12]CAB53263.1 hypothetical protein [Streptomyces coelicolor A3(2)]
MNPPSRRHHKAADRSPCVPERIDRGDTDTQERMAPPCH